MRIKDYAAETQKLEQQLTNPQSMDVNQLFDAIEHRIINIRIWEHAGLKPDDEVPEGSPRQLIQPKFSTRNLWTIKSLT